jgi:hypothetical protein
MAWPYVQGVKSAMGLSCRFYYHLLPFTTIWWLLGFLSSEESFYVYCLVLRILGLLWVHWNSNITLWLVYLYKQPAWNLVDFARNVLSELWTLLLWWPAHGHSIPPNWCVTVECPDHMADGPATQTGKMPIQMGLSMAGISHFVTNHNYKG